MRHTVLITLVPFVQKTLNVEYSTFYYYGQYINELQLPLIQGLIDTVNSFRQDASQTDFTDAYFWWSLIMKILDSGFFIKS